MKIKNFKNHLLIATPTINDPIFQKTVILVCDYSEDGAMGLIINKPINNDLIANMIIDSDLDELSIDSKIFLGGPVGLDVGFVIHDSTYCTEKSINVSKRILITSDNKIIRDIKNGCGPKNYIFTLGYAGWDAGQLDNEIKNGDWLIEKASYNFMFNTNHKDKWSLSSTMLGINFDELSGHSGLT